MYLFLSEANNRILGINVRTGSGCTCSMIGEAIDLYEILRHTEGPIQVGHSVFIYELKYMFLLPITTGNSNKILVNQPFKQCVHVTHTGAGLKINIINLHFCNFLHFQYYVKQFYLCNFILHVYLYAFLRSTVLYLIILPEL